MDCFCILFPKIEVLNKLIFLRKFFLIMENANTSLMNLLNNTKLKIKKYYILFIIIIIFILLLFIILYYYYYIYYYYRLLFISFLSIV